MLAGRPVVYADFLGYDEVAHHSGARAVRHPGRAAQHRPADRPAAPGHPAGAAALPPRRLSDHGQTQGWAFADRFGESIEELVGRLCGASAEPDPRPRGRSGRRPAAGRGLAGGRRAGRGRRPDRPPAARAGASGPGGRPTAAHPRPTAGRGAAGGARRGRGASPATPRWCPSPTIPGRVSLEEIERHCPDLLPGLVDHDGVGFLLVHSAEFGPVVFGRDGLHRLRRRRGHRRGPAGALRRARRRPGRPRTTASRTARTS